MNKIFRTAMAACLVGGLCVGASISAQAEPASSSTQTSELALLGPDRAQRAPARAVKAPVRRSTESRRRRQTVVTPPPAPIKRFTYKKKECKTLTNVPYDVNAQEHHAVWQGPGIYMLDNGRTHMWSPKDSYLRNKLGAMGADREYLNLDLSERVGVWANGRIAGKNLKSLVSGATSNMKNITCGDWSAPEQTNIAGVPVTMSRGVDVFGNYLYEVYALKRFGNTYMFATRTHYANQYNVDRNADLAYLITHIHPANWVE